MTSLLNTERPLLFCPGCSHEQIAHSLNKAFILLELAGEKIVIVSDIGCSGLFDTLFNTHAMHGLHGRALTYATGIKMVRPELNVIVTMGDGGLGIGGAHFLSACRRNLNLTLIILNNFNFGMTGGQFSSTTPVNAQVNSGFLNQLEQPMDTCKVAKAAGAPYVVRCSVYDKDLSDRIAGAISYNGMAVIDIHGICPGRYGKGNKITPAIITKNLYKLPLANGEVSENIRNEYGQQYRSIAETIKPDILTQSIKIKFKPLQSGRQEIMILGRAGQRVITAGEILCLAALTSGLLANQKNDYPITVLRGHSITDIVLETQEIGYTGIDNPNIIIAISKEGVERRKNIFKHLSNSTLIITDVKLDIPDCKAQIKKFNFAAMKIKSKDKALACLALMAKMKKIIHKEMLEIAINSRFNNHPHKDTIKVMETIIE